MGIHAKSLNQLAAELESRHPHPSASQSATPVPPCSFQNTLTQHADRLKKALENIGTVGTAPAPAPGPAGASSPTSPERPQPPPFYMDSTLGLRLHHEEAVELRKREADVRLYSGFISRGGIGGEG